MDKRGEPNLSKGAQPSLQNLHTCRLANKQTGPNTCLVDLLMRECMAQMPHKLPKAALIGAVIVVIGFAPTPLFLPLEYYEVLHAGSWFTALFPFFWTAPALLSLLLLSVAALSGRRLPRVVGVVLAILVLIAGIHVTLLSTALSGPGAVFAFVKGVSLTLACISAVLFVTKTRRAGRVIASALILFPVLTATWSVAMVPVAYVNALKIASGRPYCVAHHEPENGDIRSLADLRRTSFYTINTGYKDSSRWYFHGLLLVRGDSLELYNWSHKSGEFHRLERPADLIESPYRSCIPQDRFLQNLPWFHFIESAPPSP